MQLKHLKTLYDKEILTEDEYLKLLSNRDHLKLIEDKLEKIEERIH
jgi:hypothetical protein